MSAFLTFCKTFGLIFLAEMGDKTQLSGFALSADATGFRGRLFVFLGSAAALVLASAIAVFCGGWVARKVSPRTLKIAAGALFLVFGAMYLREGILAPGGAAR